MPAYLEAVRERPAATAGEERLDPGQARFEALALRLRTADGLDPDEARAWASTPTGRAQELRGPACWPPGRGCG